MKFFRDIFKQQNRRADRMERAPDPDKMTKKRKRRAEIKSDLPQPVSRLNLGALIRRKDKPVKGLRKLVMPSEGNLLLTPQDRRERRVRNAQKRARVRMTRRRCEHGRTNRVRRP